MIVYNSHSAHSLLRVTGSVLPAALKWAAIAGIGALVLKYMENSIMPEGMLGNLEISPAAYSGFSFTLGFVVVFRTSQCYQRFWQCTVHVNHMRAEWYEAASALTTFIVMSKQPVEEQDIFSHKVIRYFSLLHSLALQSLVDGTEAFPAIDLESLPEESLKHVLGLGDDADGMTASVELVYQWIQALIVHSMNEGLLNVPPPILTRVLQMLSSGMVHYRSVLDIISIPFPFPYAQVTFILLTFYVSFVPLIMCLLVKEAWIACVCGFLSVLCLITVDLVSTEIENPFGEDPNDLPCHEFQHKMNNSLIALMHPAAADPPELGPNAKLSFQELLEAQNCVACTNMNTPRFHGGKVKHPPKAEERVKPIPVVKEKKPQEAKEQTSVIVAEAGPISISANSAPSSERPPGVQDSDGEGGQGNDFAAQKLITQHTTMLGECVQSNGAVLERMERTLSILTTALAQQLTSLSDMHTRQLSRETEYRGVGNISREDTESAAYVRNNAGIRAVPSCFSMEAILPKRELVEVRGVPSSATPDPSEGIPIGLAQERRS